MADRFLRLHVPDDETLIAGVAVKLHVDGTYRVQEYRSDENLSRRDMAKALHELATSLELEATYDD